MIDENNLNVARLHGKNHLPRRLQKVYDGDNIPRYPQKECRVCRKMGKGRKDSRWYCPSCPGEPGLHFDPDKVGDDKDCFEIFHSVPNIKKIRNPEP